MKAGWWRVWQWEALARCLWLLCCSLFWLASMACHPASGTVTHGDFARILPTLENIGDADSIPDGLVTALAQDSRGLLWIGTQQGLVRYDGYVFRRFVHASDNPHSLSGNFVFALCATRDGRLWVGGNSDGLAVFDPATERFVRFRHDATRPDSLSPGRIWALAEDRQGGLWIATDSGLDYYRPGASGFVHFRHDAANRASLLSNQTRSLLFDRQGQLWVGSSKGLQRLVVGEQHFTTVTGAGGADESLLGKEIRSIFQAHDGKLWLGSAGHGAAWLDLTGPDRQVHWIAPDRASAFGRSTVRVTGFAQVQPDRLWMATQGGGIWIVSASNGAAMQQLRHDPALPNSLAHDWVKPMLLDRSGLLWIGTWSGGLQLHNHNNGMVRLLRHSPTQPDGLSAPDVLGILELADGRILFGTTSNGIDIYDRQQGLIGGYRAGSALPDGRITAMAQTGDGALWVGTMAGGVVRLPAGKTVWQAVPGLASTVVVSRFLPGRDGSLWLGSTHGVWHWKEGRVLRYPTAHGQPMQSRIEALAEDRAGRIWAASHDGLWCLEPNSGTWHGIHPEAGRSNSLVSNYVYGLLLDRHGSLWVATDKGLDRLLHWDGQVARFEHESNRRGWQGRDFGANLMLDQAGRIWSEFALIEPDKMQIRALGRVDGLDIGAIGTGAFAQTRDGLLMFGGTKGVAILDPARFSPWIYQPPVVVTELKINGKTIAENPLAAVGGLPVGHVPQLVLTPEQRNFSVVFSALDYSEPKKNRYQYRLQGYDKGWIDTDFEHRSATYGNLWPGKYMLQVRGSNRLGHLEERELAIAIQVLPAFWQTWWFALFAVLLAAGLLHGIYRWRTRRLQTIVAARTVDILKLGQIGQELTATLDIEQAFLRVYQQIMARLDAHVFLIGMVDDAAQLIRFVYEIENGQRQPMSSHSLGEENRPAVWCVRQRRELWVGQRGELANYVSSVLPPSMGKAMETIVYLPLLFENRVIGCLSVQSLRRNAYRADQLEFLRILASYSAIALANATAHGELAQAHRQVLETQQQMLLQEKMAGLGTLTAGVAHEINNPTNFVHVAAQNQRVDIAEFRDFVTAMLEDDAADGILPEFEQRFDQLAKNINIMLNGTERIKAIVRDLRSFTRLDEAEKKSVHLSECLNSTLNLVRTSWQERVEFICRFYDDPEIECWPALLNQVFMNLLVNGCQAIAERGQETGDGQLTVVMKLTPDQAAIEVAFCDNGVGMTPEVQARIMEPFYSTKAVGAGTGLGLSIAFGIVQKHGGSLSVHSTPGGGSRFVVQLPLPTVRQG